MKRKRSSGRRRPQGHPARIAREEAEREARVAESRKRFIAARLDDLQAIGYIDSWRDTGTGVEVRPSEKALREAE